MKPTGVLLQFTVTTETCHQQCNLVPAYAGE